MRVFRKFASVSLGLLVLAVPWALGDIRGSKHDFSDKSWSGGDTCGACHTPQKDGLPPSPPAWNPNADLTRTFGRKNKKADARGMLLCLSCHDGTVAKATGGGVWKKSSGNTRSARITGTGHGTSDHPVGVDFPQFQKGYHPITFVTARGAVLLPDGRVECTSCHDPHDMSGAAHMLVMSNARSALCLTCHKK